MSYLLRIAQIYQDVELTQAELAYYARHILLPSIGIDGQRKLKSARVLVVGAGGLGCPALQALAGAGVGHLTIIDGDTVHRSNLSRQWLHRFEDNGQNKALSAKKAVCAMNPFIEVVAEECMLCAKNAAALIGAHDLVIDATDDLDVRYTIDDHCAVLDRPWVHAALYRERSQLTVFWDRCGSSFRKLYPEPSGAPTCSGAGMLGASASVVGNFQAIEAIKLITGEGQPKIGELVSFDATGLSLQSFKMPRVNSPVSIPTDTAERLSEIGLSVFAVQQAHSIHEPMTLLDLRTGANFEAGTIPGAIHYTDTQLLEEGLPGDIKGKVLLLCEEGVVSLILADALRSRCPNIYFLEGGLRAWRHLNHTE
ncbi:MAG: molybdopterin/thiamine biosynthesis adenylyltransferase/rhodanese-related sulfurtransferase [Bacteroidia bacterium]|jgi:molybdopterin/thiamine biosynthesis adenylyltransferase/rhodanese-related sulfurtransferase